MVGLCEERVEDEGSDVDQSSSEAQSIFILLHHNVIRTDQGSRHARRPEEPEIITKI
jgi:hypothetical protein